MHPGEQLGGTVHKKKTSAVAQGCLDGVMLVERVPACTPPINDLLPL